MLYVDEVTFQELQRLVFENQERVDAISKRLTELESEVSALKERLDHYERMHAIMQMPMSPRDPKFWDVMIDEFCGSTYAEVAEIQEFSQFVKFVNKNYPECMDLVFEIWASRNESRE